MHGTCRDLYRAPTTSRFQGYGPAILLYIGATLYRENKPCPLAAMFFDESRLHVLEQSWYRVTMETFLPSYNEIGPVVSDKKIFQVF